MRIVKPEVIVEDKVDGMQILRNLERYGRVCYKSENRITDDSAKEFIKHAIEIGHHSIIEHERITVRIICDRGVTHEIVRHRVASYSQESTRYCNYGKDKFGNEIAVIDPCFWPDRETLDSDDYAKYRAWELAMREAEGRYMELLSYGATPQEARSVLPNSLKTEIIVTFNIREWRHFFKLRGSKAVHPQMREIVKMAWEKLSALVPVVFDDCKPED